MSRSPAARRRDPGRDRDLGFTLVEMLIALVLSGIIAGVTVAAMVTSMNAVDSTTDQVSDSTDAGLISAYLFRDAQAAGGTDPATSRSAVGVGVATAATVAAMTAAAADPWAGCAQTGDLVVRFSWLERSADAAGAVSVVATYALDGQHQLNRRVCQAGTPVDLLLGRSIATAAATCTPDPACGATTSAVSLTVSGTGTRSPFTYTLTASLRAERQPIAAVANSAQVPLLVLGRSTPALPCPNLSLQGTGTTVVVGDAVVADTCGAAPIGGDQTRLRPTGVTSILSGIVDPYALVAATPAACDGSANPSPLGASTGPDAVVVHPRRVTITGTVDLAPGRYVFCNGLDINDGGVLTGSGVFLDLVGGTLTVAPTAEVRLGAASTGERSNLLIRVSTPQVVRIEQAAKPLVFSGVLDAPTSTVELAGSAPIGLGGLVARDVRITGSSPIRLGQPIPAVAIAATPMPTGEVGIASPVTVLTATGGVAPYTWAATGLPAGLTLSSSGLLTGTPTTAGDSTMVLTVLDATNAAAQVSMPLHVQPAPTVTGPTSLPDGQAGSPYSGGGASAAVAVSGGVAPFTWSATGMPTGMSISAAGAIGGTPTASGTFSVTVRVTDAAGGTATRTVSLVVRDPLTIASPVTLADARIGIASTPVTIVGNGGATPYHWSATGLPSGMTLDGFGILGGTPTVTGSYGVTITLIDAGGLAATRTYTLSVLASDTGGNPMAAARGFQLMVEHDAIVGTYGLAGGVAVGGNLVFQNYQTVASAETSLFIAPSADRAAAVVVGGAVDLPTSGSGNQLTVGTGLLHVGSLGTGNLLTFGTATHLAPAGITDDWSTPRVIVQADQTNQTIDAVVQPNVFPFASTFSSLRASAASMAALDPATCPAIARPTVTQAYGNYTVTLVAGKVNVWNLTLAQITAMSNVSGPTNPDATTSLVINVTDGGSVAVPARYWTPIQQGAANAILWNFPNATAVSVGNGFAGTLFAPNAAVSIQNIQLHGDVVASSLALVQGNGTIAHFSPVIPCIFGSLSITQPAVLPRAQVGIAYPATTPTASGGLSPYTWAATGVPAGMTIAVDGTISGTPTVAGGASVSITVTDASGVSVVRTYVLTVDPGPSVATSSLPVGEVAVAYPTTHLVATGGTSPYRWTATGLPAGLTMTTAGNISGTPTAAGQPDVSFTVTDAVGATATLPLRLVVAASTCAAQPGLWAGQYYANPTLTGTPTMCRQDAAINFSWGGGSPGGGVPTDNFSVRWTTTAAFQAATYEFTKGSDDGWRMYIDGALVLDDWNYQSYANGIRKVSQLMTAGTHTLVVEYFEGGGDAAATLDWAIVPTVTCPSSPVGWLGAYFRGRDLAGSPALCRDDSSVDLAWGGGSPGAGVPVDDFSARWTRTLSLAAGDYRFTVGSDDGVRLRIDGALVIDHWADRSYGTDAVTVPLSAGDHVVVMEYYERGGDARATLRYEVLTSAGCPASPTGWLARYYAGKAFDGPVLLCRDDASIDLDWGGGSPGTDVPVDDFSARWTRSVTFAAGTYTFVAGSDDGVRVSIDGVLVIDTWTDRSYATTSATRTLTAGTHTIVMEYYERGGQARASLTWS